MKDIEKNLKSTMCLLDIPDQTHVVLVTRLTLNEIP